MFPVSQKLEFGDFRSVLVAFLHSGKKVNNGSSAIDFQQSLASKLLCWKQRSDGLG